MIKNKSIQNALFDLNLNQGSNSHKKSQLVLSPYLRSTLKDFSIKTASFAARIQLNMIENLKCNFNKQYLPMQFMQVKRM